MPRQRRSRRPVERRVVGGVEQVLVVTAGMAVQHALTIVSRGGSDILGKNRALAARAVAHDVVDVEPLVIVAPDCYDGMFLEEPVHEVDLGALLPDLVPLPRRINAVESPALPRILVFEQLFDVSAVLVAH